MWDSSAKEDRLLWLNVCWYTDWKSALPSYRWNICDKHYKTIKISYLRRTSLWCTCVSYSRIQKSIHCLYFLIGRSTSDNWQYTGNMNIKYCIIIYTKIQFPHIQAKDLRIMFTYTFWSHLYNSNNMKQGCIYRIVIAFRSVIYILQ